VTADDVIERLGLVPHPREGGFFRETWRSDAAFLPGDAFAGERSVGTAIYYLLTPETWSALHRLPGDEVFHFYLGDPVEMLELLPDGSSRTTVLGPGIDGMRPQHVVRGGVWQGARLRAGGAWALLGTTMAPGFSYDDYEQGDASIVAAWPDAGELARALLPPDEAG
jgi:predicted cupin superfamily sugar epimerase